MRGVEGARAIGFAFIQQIVDAHQARRGFMPVIEGVLQMRRNVGRGHELRKIARDHRERTIPALRERGELHNVAPNGFPPGVSGQAR